MYVSSTHRARKNETVFIYSCPHSAALHTHGLKSKSRKSIYMHNSYDALMAHAIKYTDIKNYYSTMISTTHHISSQYKRTLLLILSKSNLSSSKIYNNSFITEEATRG